MRQVSKLVPAVAVAVLVAACGSTANMASSSGSPASGGSGKAMVKIAPVSSLGSSVLVDAQGLTLYHLSGEQNGKWICTSAGCVATWHPLVAAAAGVPGGTLRSLGTVKRPGGALQVTYKGMPLYTFAGDTKAGEAKGQGVKDVGVWTAITANGALTGAKASGAAPASSSSSSSGGRYGY